MLARRALAIDDGNKMAGSGDDAPGARDRDGETITLVVEYENADDFLGDHVASLASGSTVVATARELPAGTAVRLVLQFPGLLKPIALDGIVHSTSTIPGGPASHHC